MSYENPQQPEGINVTDERPLRDFFSMLVVVLLIVAVSVAALSLSAQWLARYIPFSVEQKIANSLPGSLRDLTAGSVGTSTSEQLEKEAYLRQLASRLQAHMNLPEDMVVTVHYSEDDTVNAYATLGGHVVIFAGLLDKLPNENALAMVVAHEIAHVQLRHPVVATSRSLAVVIALGSVFGLTDNAATAQFVQWLGVTSTLSFNRSQERDADRLAAQAVAIEYGHLNGAADLFRVLDADQGEDQDPPGEGSQNDGSKLRVPEFFSTHPLGSERIFELDQKSIELGRGGPTTPLPWSKRSD